MTFHDSDDPRTIGFSKDPNDPHNYIPKRDGGFGVGMLAGILFGMPFGFFGASIGALLGSLVGAFVDQKQHDFDVARERHRIEWNGRGRWYVEQHERS